MDDDSWSFGLNGIPWIVSAEIFPGALRNFSGTFAALIQWAIQFAITKALPYIFTSFGYGTWFFFASWMLVASTWSFFFLPETKGLTIAQMDVILYVKLAILLLKKKTWTLTHFLLQWLQLRGTSWDPPYVHHNQAYTTGSRHGYDRAGQDENCRTC